MPLYYYAAGSEGLAQSLPPSDTIAWGPLPRSLPLRGAPTRLATAWSSLSCVLWAVAVRVCGTDAPATAAGPSREFSGVGAPTPPAPTCEPDSLARGRGRKTCPPPLRLAGLTLLAHGLAGRNQAQQQRWYSVSWAVPGSDRQSCRVAATRPRARGSHRCSGRR